MTAHLLAQIWFGIVLLEAALYVILDGGNLGIGILSLVPQPAEKRDMIMRAFGPMWDANETWLLIAAATLYGAFPAVYSIALNALFIPAMTFGIGLVLRVVSYEFYHTGKYIFWRRLFGAASLLAVIGQGLLFGGLISGITIVNGHFGGGPFDWATLVTALLTVGITFGYLVLGYTYLVRFADYELAPHALSRLIDVTAGALVALVTATFFIPSSSYLFFERWTTPPASHFLYAIAALIMIVGTVFAYDVFMRKNPRHLYYLCIAIFALGFVGMVIGIYPYILPPAMTIFEASSSPATQMFMLWGIGPMLPIVIAYNYFIRRIFRHDDAWY